MPTDNPTPDPLDALIRRAKRASEKDVARVSMGLDARIMSQIRGTATAPATGWQDMDWTRGFIRGAAASLALVLALSAWAAMNSVFPSMMDEYSLSPLEEATQIWNLTGW